MNNDLTSVAYEIEGGWEFDGDASCLIEIEADSATEIVATDSASIYWNTATGRLVFEDGHYILKMQFDNGDQVDGTLSDDFQGINWANGTTWSRS